MKIFQRMLFVGLGGTGGQIGTELERRLRAELCGPDGTLLTGTGRRQPYQLPDCLQFVYADYSEAELAKLPHLSVDPALQPAYARTSRATHDLLPAGFDSCAEVTQMLRAGLRSAVSDWLPPSQGEPTVTPLKTGAGQLPTVGRAALFATLGNGPAPVLEPLRRAVDAIGLSNAEMRELGNGHPQADGCAVFVAFSVAGGTGGGIFLDYLHLIGQVFREKNMSATIYPLVVMPSAFSPGQGGGREADLNAARAVVDLSRLIDEQNGRNAQSDLGDTERRETLRLSYPQMAPVRLRSGTVPTAFLFSPTTGIGSDDLHRSIVSLVVSLIGTDPGAAGKPGSGSAPEEDQSFASNFVNGGIRRNTKSPIGIGKRGISSSLVASMTAPLDELTELVAARMLALAVRDLDKDEARSGQDLAPLVKEMFTASGLAELWRRDPLPVPEPDPLPKGSTEIEKALRERIDNMQRLLGDLKLRADRRARALAKDFDPTTAVDKMLRAVDLFTLEAVVKGVPGHQNQVAALGFHRMLENRRHEPPRPVGLDVRPPSVPRIKRKLTAVTRLHWTDEDVAAAVAEQDRWYKWRTRTVWHEAWNAQETLWRHRADDLLEDVQQLMACFREHVKEEPRTWKRGVKELYTERAGVSYLLPPQKELRDFYEELRERLLESEGLGTTGSEGDVLLEIVDAEHRQLAYKTGRRTPGDAVAMVKAVFQHHVRELFTARGRRRAASLLPGMATLLAAAAGDPAAKDEVGSTAVQQFDYKLAGLLPLSFTPEGNGPLKILITYPSRQGNANAIKEYLEKTLRLPKEGRRDIVFQGGDEKSITVVLLRSEMSLSQIPGVRQVMRVWAEAQENRHEEDKLRWRQRLGYQDEWLASTAQDRAHILQRLLCAIWNGQVDFQGHFSSPERVRFRLHDELGPDKPSMTLRLEDHREGVSSWSSLLRAYERWALLDEEQSIVVEYCRVLMADVLPQGLGAAGSKPSDLYLKLVHEVAPRQVAMLEEEERRYGSRVLEWARPMREFWAEILPAALELPFPGGEGQGPANLEELEEWVQGGGYSDGGGTGHPAAPSPDEPKPHGGRGYGYSSPDDRSGTWRREPSPSRDEASRPVHDRGEYWARDDRGAPRSHRPQELAAERSYERARAHGSGEPVVGQEHGPAAASSAGAMPQNGQPYGGRGDDQPAWPGPGPAAPRAPRAGRASLGAQPRPTAPPTAPRQPADYPEYPGPDSLEDAWPGEEAGTPWGFGGDGEADWDDVDNDRAAGEPSAVRRDPWEEDPE
ncbi:tubulin-like doman-containing protein [Streptomyces sp. NPDC019890]|uniref:tubulin-like doman-containing protein n=1 Tax=Streptomyces sp. NPDC019890 TaxID=3365064 RepID=UPI00384A5C2A